MALCNTCEKCEFFLLDVDGRYHIWPYNLCNLLDKLGNGGGIKCHIFIVPFNFCQPMFKQT